MRTSDPRSWMWSEALEMLARADRMHRHLFEPQRPEDVRQPCWEPPVDMLETEHEIIVITALPGVDPASIRTTIAKDVLEIFGQRVLPPELSKATIHRLELPQGCFRRQLRIPPGTYGDIHRAAINGCLVVTLRKQQTGR
jgi:HSP20 family protein